VNIEACKLWSGSSRLRWAPASRVVHSSTTSTALFVLCLKWHVETELWFSSHVLWWCWIIFQYRAALSRRHVQSHFLPLTLMSCGSTVFALPP